MSFTPQEIKDAGLDDFRVFLRQVWDYLHLPEPTPVQNDIARNLQNAPRRFILSAFRGVGKSWITVAYVLWLLLNDPQKKIEVVSANESLAHDFTKFCFQLIHGMPMLSHLAPREGQRKSAEKFDVGPSTASKDPSVKSVGITGQLTGSRADVIIADDIEIPKNSYTHLLRERLSELVKEFDAVLKPGGKIVYLGTPQVEDSLYVKLLKRGYSISIWPAEVPTSLSAYAGRLAPFVVRKIDKERLSPGDPLDPRRFSREDLSERRVSYGPAGYELQFLLNTTPASAEKHPLKLSDLLVMDVDPEVAPVKLMWSSEREYTVQDLQAGGFDGDHYQRPSWRSDEVTKYSGTVMAIDPSGKGRDETAYAIVRYLQGMLYLVEVGGFRDGFSEATLRAISLSAKRHNVNSVIAEENYGGGMFNQLLKPHLVALKAGSFDEEWNGWSVGQKELRILDTLEPVVRNHRLVVDRRVLEADLIQQQEDSQYSWVQQFTRMERVKGALPHEDRLEAIAQACQYWVERMDRDKDRALEQHRSALLDEALRAFRKNVFSVGGGSSYRRW